MIFAACSPVYLGKFTEMKIIIERLIIVIFYDSVERTNLYRCATDWLCLYNGIAT